MDFFPCPVCSYNHSFQVCEDRPCPNLGLSMEKSQQIFNKPSVLYEPLGPFKKKKEVVKQDDSTE